MNIVPNELFAHPGEPGMIVVTTNATIKRNGALVMGRGAARQARDLIRNIDREAGAVISHNEMYGFRVVRSPFRDGRVGFGIFQVKMHYRDIASLPLITYAVASLKQWIHDNDPLHIKLNFPGIGNGRLSRKDVEPILTSLPDCVTICIRGEYFPSFISPSEPQYPREEALHEEEQS